MKEKTRGKRGCKIINSALTPSVGVFVLSRSDRYELPEKTFRSPDKTLRYYNNYCMLLSRLTSGGRCERDYIMIRYVQCTLVRIRYFSVRHRLYLPEFFSFSPSSPCSLSPRLSSDNPVPVTRDPIFLFLPVPLAPTSPPPIDAWAAKCSILVPGLLYTI